MSHHDDSSMEPLVLHCPVIDLECGKFGDFPSLPGFLEAYIHILCRNCTKDVPAWVHPTLTIVTGTSTPIYPILLCNTISGRGGLAV